MRNDGVIYFHGLGSSPNTDKVQELKKHFSEVYAFPIDPDPDVSLPYLEKEIDDVFIKTFNQDNALVFVGTSLGAWYAGWFAKKFYSPAILINPRYSGNAFKKETGLSEELNEKYEKLGFEYPYETKFFIDPEDELIDMRHLSVKLADERVEDRLQYYPEYIYGATHRFNGEPFERVIDFIKETKF